MILLKNNLLTLLQRLSLFVLIVLLLTQCKKDEKEIETLMNKIEVWENVYRDKSEDCKALIKHTRNSIEENELENSYEVNKRLDSVLNQLKKLDEDCGTISLSVYNYLEDIDNVSYSDVETISENLEVIKSNKNNPSVFDLYQKGIMNVNKLRMQLNKIKKDADI